ncbi:MAG TPA: hypothetical protein VK084_02170 [Chitinophagaceae bacterium]|nr:hypothetical protein [Chitinophagaceae bacterium]
MKKSMFYGATPIRFTNSEVTKEVEKILATIKDYIKLNMNINKIKKGRAIESSPLKGGRGL